MTKQDLIKEHDLNKASIGLSQEIKAEKKIIKYSKQLENLLHKFDYSGIDILNSELKKIDTHFGIEGLSLYMKEKKNYPFIYFEDDNLKIHYVCDIIPTEEISTLNASKTLSNFIYNISEKAYHIIELENALDKSEEILKQVDKYIKEGNQDKLNKFLESVPNEFKFYFGLLNLNK